MGTVVKIYTACSKCGRDDNCFLQTVRTGQIENFCLICVHDSYVELFDAKANNHG